MVTAVLKNSLFILLLISTSYAWSQKKSDQLQAEQNKLEKKLSTTKSLLDKVKKGTETSLNELKLIENQVKNRELLVRNFDNQIRSAELTISSKGDQIKELQKKLVRLKDQYKKLLIYAYKHRNKSAKMMYIFSSSNYFEAVKRTSYLKRLSEVQQKQFKVILQNENTINKEIKTIHEENEHKKRLLGEKIIEKQQIEKDKNSKQQALEKLRKDESSLMAELKEQERQKAELKRRIKLAIEKEIAEAEAKAKRDAYVIFFLSFFCMLSQFLYSQSLLTALSMTVAFVGLLSALVQAHMPVGNVTWRQTTGMALRMMLWGSPIMLVLFMVFPRIAPLWGLPNGGASGKTGLSNEMRVGNLASLAQDDSIALRVLFKGQTVAQSQAYFRGPVLDWLNDQTWRSYPLDGAAHHPANSLAFNLNFYTLAF